MKLEKREITLNEQDSLRDLLLLEKSLLSEYVAGVVTLRRKELRECVLDLIQETAREVFLARDLLEKTCEDGVMKK